MFSPLPQAARRPLVGTGALWLPAGAAFSKDAGGRMPKQGDAVCLAAGRSHPKLRAGRRYTVTEVDIICNIQLADAATGEEIDGFIKDPSLLAPAEEVEELPALHCALYLGREPGVVCALLEAHGEVSGEGGVRVRGRGLRGRGRPRLRGQATPTPTP